MIKATASSLKSPLPLLIALGLNAFVLVGTLYNLQPMDQLITWNANIKQYQQRVQGNPPYGHAELSSLEKFCGFLNLDVDTVISTLKGKNLKGEITPKTTVLEVATTNGLTPQALYELIQKSFSNNPYELMPPSPPEGTGLMTLAQLSTTYNLPLDDVLKKLQAQGLEVEPQKSLKELAKINGIEARDIYQLVRADSK